MARWAGQHFHCTFQAKARGVLILIDPNVPFEPFDTIPDTNSRFIITSGKLYNVGVVLAYVYAHILDDVRFFFYVFFPLYLTLIQTCSFWVET